ncbi:MAG: hypothetical protein RRY20_03945 [Bilophila sp.]
MTASSKFSLILMHDDGEMHRLRMNKGTLRVLILLLVLSPLLGMLGLWVGWDAWHTIADWHTERLSYQTQLDALRVRLERLSALEALLGAEGDRALVPASTLPPPDAVARTSSETVPGEPKTAAPAALESEASTAAGQSAAKPSEDETLPDKARAAVDTGVIRVENMQARIVDRRRIRASVDMFNSDPDGKPLGGRTEFSLITADGQQYPLSNEDAVFRISRFKKVVSTSTLPVAGTEVENAAVMVEVKADNTVLYRNMFSIESR